MTAAILAQVHLGAAIAAGILAALLCWLGWEIYRAPEE